jgi:hypothetical protein
VDEGLCFGITELHLRPPSQRRLHSGRGFGPDTA